MHEGDQHILHFLVVISEHQGNRARRGSQHWSGWAVLYDAEQAPPPHMYGSGTEQVSGAHLERLSGKRTWQKDTL